MSEPTPAITLYMPDFASVQLIACSPTAWSVMIALEEKGLPYSRHVLSFPNAEHRSREMLDRNPRGTVPVLTDGARVVYEAFAILEYLDLAYPTPPLMPADLDGRARALTRFHESAGLKALGIELFSWLMHTPEGARPPERIEGMSSALHRELTVWERHYGESAWAAGEAISLADICVFVYVATAVHLGLDVGEWYPNLARFYEAMRERPSVRATWPATWQEQLDLLG